MRYLSVCSGIEAASVAWAPLSWEPIAFAEIEAFPSAVLKHHYPAVPNWGDMTRYREWPDVAIDLLVGGTPCQSFSVAGLRQGLDDPRGNLALVFLGIVDRYRPRWVVWENVPGVRSSDDGRDFGAFLGGLGELGYGWAFRSLDAQYFDLAQRRERVFVVGHAGDWRPPCGVLLEPESMSGDLAPSREARKGTARSVEISAAGGRFADVAPTMDTRASNGPMQNQAGVAVLIDCPEIADCLTAREHKGPQPEADRGVLLAFSGQSLAVDNDVAATLDTGAAHSNRGMHVAHALRGRPNASHRADSDNYVAHTLRAEHDASEDGIGRGTPLVVGSLGENDGAPRQLQSAMQGHLVVDIQQITSPLSGALPSPIAPAMSPGARLVAFEAEDVAPTLRPGMASMFRGDGADHVAYSLGSHAGAADADVSNRNHANGGPSGMGISEEVSHTLRADRTQAVGFYHMMTHPNAHEEIMPPIMSAHPGHAVAFGSQMSTPHWQLDHSDTLQAKNPKAVSTGAAVRRLTPRECERLMGLPDDYTLVPYRKQLAKDGPRYRALGNSFAVPVVRWIGARIALMDDVLAAAPKVEQKEYETPTPSAAAEALIQADLWTQ